MGGCIGRSVRWENQVDGWEYLALDGEINVADDGRPGQEVRRWEYRLANMEQRVVNNP